MFEHDRLAARGEMTTRRLYVFEHSSRLGNALAHELFARINPKSESGGSPPHAFADYVEDVEESGLPGGVNLHRKVG